MRAFVTAMNVEEDSSVLDLGGQPMIWDGVQSHLNITILNLPGIAVIDHATKHTINYITGDACNVECLGDRSFDIVFSNSVIEHVGSPEQMAAFAREARRLGRSYWIQTPSKYFPIEAHCGMPFWWFHPKSVRSYFIGRWRKKLPAWTNMVEGTTVLTKLELQNYFPESRIIVERFLGIPKSYVSYYVQSSVASRPFSFDA
jgi:predicted SAM-dependent methyltransferase